jgi:serine/threonine protein phosphatase PrpC
VAVPAADASTPAPTPGPWRPTIVRSGGSGGAKKQYPPPTPRPSDDDEDEVDVRGSGCGNSNSRTGAAAPARVIFTHHGGSGDAGADWGAWACTGARERMEDAHIARSSLPAATKTEGGEGAAASSRADAIGAAAAEAATAAPSSMAYYALFDGHSGAYAAHHAAAHLHVHIARHPAFAKALASSYAPSSDASAVAAASAAELLASALGDAFLACDSELLALQASFSASVAALSSHSERQQRQKDAQCGSTALAALLLSRGGAGAGIGDNSFELAVASLGDSRAVLGTTACGGTRRDTRVTFRGALRPAASAAAAAAAAEDTAHCSHREQPLPPLTSAISFPAHVHVLHTHRALSHHEAHSQVLPGSPGSQQQQQQVLEVPDGAVAGSDGDLHADAGAGASGTAAALSAPPSPLLCSGNLCALVLSVEHSPAAEVGRIVSSGGWVDHSRERLWMSSRRIDPRDRILLRLASERGAAGAPERWAHVSRVCGELAVARSFGDPQYKKGGSVAASAAAEVAAAAPLDLVLAAPDVLSLELLPGDAFLILACDGLWEALSTEEAVLIAAELLRQGLLPRDAARRLVQLAIDLGSHDNVTAMIVILPTAPGEFRGR